MSTIDQFARTRTSPSNRYFKKVLREPTPNRREAVLFGDRRFSLAYERRKCGRIGAYVKLVGVPFRLARGVFRDVGAVRAAPVGERDPGVRLERHHLYEVSR